MAAFVAMLAIGAISAPGAARAGELTFQGCATEDGRVGPKGSGACATPRRAGGLFPLSALGGSPDGRSLYTGASLKCYGLSNPRCAISATVGRFDLERRTGGLRYRDCLTGLTDDVCTAIPNAARDAYRAGLGAVEGMAVSPDGEFVYAVSNAIVCAVNDAGTFCYGSGVLTTFGRDQDSGELTYEGCVTGDMRSGPSGSGACAEIPSATADGHDSGLDDLGAVALTPDGESLYAGAKGDASVARFDRNPTTGALMYRGCISGDVESGPSGSGACQGIAGATEGARHSGLNGLSAFAVSGDGRSLYATANRDMSLAIFARDPSTGTLAYKGCLTAKASVGPNGSGACKRLGETAGLGLRGVDSLAVTPDGESVFATAVDAKAISQFDRAPGSGALGFVKTYRHAHGPLASRGNEWLFAGLGDAGVLRFKRDRNTGKLTRRGCVTGSKEGLRTCLETRTATRDGTFSGLLLPGTAERSRSSMIVRRGSIYVGAAGDSAVARLAVAPQTKIKRGPKGKTRRHRAAFRFRADHRSRFECKLKGKRVKRKLRLWRRCGGHAPKRHGRKTYRHLASGRKVFKARATDAAGTTDPTPAKRRWRIR